MKTTTILRICILIVLGVVVLSGILYYCFHINFLSILPSQSICPIHHVTGHDCPGCGMTRAFLLIGQLKWVQAFHANIFSIPLFLFMLAYLSWRKPPAWLQHPMVAVGLLVAMVVYWIVRF